MNGTGRGLPGPDPVARMLYDKTLCTSHRANEDYQEIAQVKLVHTTLLNTLTLVIEDRWAIRFLIIQPKGNLQSSIKFNLPTVRCHGATGVPPARACLRYIE